MYMHAYINMLSQHFGADIQKIIFKCYIYICTHVYTEVHVFTYQAYFIHAYILTKTFCIKNEIILSCLFKLSISLNRHYKKVVFVSSDISKLYAGAEAIVSADHDRKIIHTYSMYIIYICIYVCMYVYLIFAYKLRERLVCDVQKRCSAIFICTYVSYIVHIFTIVLFIWYEYYGYYKSETAVRS